MNKIAKNFGFTLIELIIAIAIFAVIATASYNALSSFNQGTKVYNTQTDSLINLQKTSLIISRDFSQIFANELDLTNQEINFLSKQNGKILNISYRFNNNKIERIVDDYKITLLDNLDKIKLRVLDNHSRWHIIWQKSNTKSYLRALELKFTHPKYGEITKLAFIDE